MSNGARLQVAEPLERDLVDRLHEQSKHQLYRRRSVTPSRPIGLVGEAAPSGDAKYYSIATLLGWRRRVTTVEVTTA